MMSPTPVIGAAGPLSAEELASIGGYWDRLIEHREYISEYGEDLPDIRNWRWAAAGFPKAQ
jgi:phosphoketolase